MPDAHKAALAKGRQEGRTVRSYLEALEAKGLTTVPSAKMAEKPVPRSTLSRMLRNPYYTGVLRWKGVTHPGNHPELVSQGTFDRVQDVLNAHNVSSEKQRVHQHYLKGSVRCGSCGSRLCSQCVAAVRFL